MKNVHNVPRAEIESEIAESKITIMTKHPISKKPKLSKNSNEKGSSGTSETEDKGTKSE